MIQINSSLSFLILLSVFALLSFNCSNENKEQTSKENLAETTGQTATKEFLYDDWKTYTYKHIKIIYPPGHPLEDDLPAMASGYIKARDYIANFFRIREPAESLFIYYYTGVGQGREITGRHDQHVDGNILHFWLPGYYGTTLTEYLISKWQPQEPSFPFLKQGLMRLLDYSGIDYHERTLNNIDNGNFKSLAELAVDTTINVYDENIKSGMSASFIAFFVDSYGMDGLESLYLSEYSFEKSIDMLFKITPDSLQKDWLEYVNKVYEEKLRQFR